MSKKLIDIIPVDDSADTMPCLDPDWKPETQTRKEIDMGLQSIISETLENHTRCDSCGKPQMVAVLPGESAGDTVCQCAEEKPRYRIDRTQNEDYPSFHKLHVYDREHRPSWERYPDTDVCSGAMDFEGNSEKQWLQIETVEYGTKSTKSTMFTLHEDQVRALRDLLNTILDD